MRSRVGICIHQSCESQILRDPDPRGPSYYVPPEWGGKNRISNEIWRSQCRSKATPAVQGSKTADVNGMLANLRAVAGAMAELVLPSRCAACGVLVDPNAVFCPACDVSVLSIDRCCIRCGLPDVVPRCVDCRARPPGFLWARGSVLYGGQVATAITRFKYGRCSHLARPLSRLMFARLAALGDGDLVVVPVPLHRRKLARRGFNQAALLARHASRHFGLPVAYTALRRERDTERQVGLNRQSRQQNVDGAFCARGRIVAGRRVLLIDDVMTTGATARACSSALLSAGARGVVVATLARAVG